MIENDISFEEISYKTAIDFLLPRHYSGRKPNISKAFGLFIIDGLRGIQIQAVCTFGKPNNGHLCRGICGPEWSENVYELTRLCRSEDCRTPMSKFIGFCLREIKKKNDWIIVSYADSGANHCGYIYQATNFIYTGKTKLRLVPVDLKNPNLHSRSLSSKAKSADLYSNGYAKIRSEKHRYVVFCTKNKMLKKQWEESLKYPIYPYPKEKNSNYVLGEFLKPIIVEIGTKNDLLDK